MTYTQLGCQELRPSLLREALKGGGRSLLSRVRVETKLLVRSVTDVTAQVMTDDPTSLAFTKHRSELDEIKLCLIHAAEQWPQFVQISFYALHVERQPP